MWDGVLVLNMGEVRGLDWHGGKVFSGAIVGAVLVGRIKVRDLMISHSRGGTGGATSWHIDQQSFIDGLTTRIVGV